HTHTHKLSELLPVHPGTNRGQVVFQDSVAPAQVGFRCQDRTLNMPYVDSGDELIPLLMLLSLAFAGPAASVSTYKHTLTHTHTYTKERSQTTYTPRHTHDSTHTNHHTHPHTHTHAHTHVRTHTHTHTHTISYAPLVQDQP